MCPVAFRLLDVVVASREGEIALVEPVLEIDLERDSLVERVIERCIDPDIGRQHHIVAQRCELLRLVDQPCTDAESFAEVIAPPGSDLAGRTLLQRQPSRGGTGGRTDFDIEPSVAQADVMIGWELSHQPSYSAIRETPGEGSVGAEGGKK